MKNKESTWMRRNSIVLYFTLTYLRHLLDDLVSHRCLHAGLGEVGRPVCALLFWLLWPDALGADRHCIDRG
jgi:hypothetical protein